ncbi:MAG: hypothetical protein V4722_03185 [Bacteroidota bacterium]
MKNFIFVPVILFIAHTTAFCQPLKVKWSAQFEQKKGTTGVDAFFADETGCFFHTSSLKRYGFLFSNTFKLEHGFFKTGKSQNVEYEKILSDEMIDGYDFLQFIAIKNKLFLFATKFFSKQDKFAVFASEIVKKTGDLAYPLKEVFSINDFMPFDDDKDILSEITVQPSLDSNAIVVYQTISKPEGDNLGLIVLDESLASLQKSFINLCSTGNKYSLKSAYVTAAKKIITTGSLHVYEQTTVKKKTEWHYKSSSVNLRIHSADGKMEKDVAVSAGDKIRDLYLQPLAGRPWLLCGFTSLADDPDHYKGFFAASFDLGTGVVSGYQNTVFDGNIIGKLDNGKPAKADKKKGASEPVVEKNMGLSNLYTIQKVLYNPANAAFILLAEEIVNSTGGKISAREYKWNKTLSKMELSYFSTVTTIMAHGNILIMKMDNAFATQWSKVLSKYQLEQINDVTPSNGSSGTDLGQLAIDGGGWPYFSSFTPFISNNQLHILFNDIAENKNVTGIPAETYKPTGDLASSSMFDYTIDLGTNVAKRNLMYTNRGTPVAMPKYTYITGNTLYLPALTRGSLSKSDVMAGKIVLE